MLIHLNEKPFEISILHGTIAVLIENSLIQLNLFQPNPIFKGSVFPSLCVSVSIEISQSYGKTDGTWVATDKHRIRVSCDFVKVKVLAQTERRN